MHEKRGLGWYNVAESAYGIFSSALMARALVKTKSLAKILLQIRILLKSLTLAPIELTIELFRP